MTPVKLKAKVYPDSSIPNRQTHNLGRVLFATMGIGLVVKAAVVGISFLGQSNAAALSTRLSAPTAAVKNGTLVGEYNSFYDQEFFLGIPYAQPPVGDLRYRVPVPLNSSWDGTKTATEYSPECVGYGVSKYL